MDTELGLGLLKSQLFTSGVSSSCVIQTEIQVSDYLPDLLCLPCLGGLLALASFWWVLREGGGFT